MVRIKVVWYWKRYMRKNRYHYKRYYLPLPKTIGDLLDTKVEYTPQLFGAAIVYLPRGLENPPSLLQKLENPQLEKSAHETVALTNSLQEKSRMIKHGE